MSSLFRATSFNLIIAGNILYLLSDIVLKKFFPSANTYEVSFFRFAPGAALCIFVTYKNIINIKAIFFATINVLNSICGVIALQSGTLTGCTIISQLKPIMFSTIAYIILREKIANRNIFL